jgi:hypothetical protein
MEPAMQRGSPDDQIINLTDGDEINHWCRVLDITPDLLKTAVHCVGPEAVNVRGYLRYRRSDA